MTTSTKLYLGFGTLTVLLMLFGVTLTLRIRSIKANVDVQANVARPRSAATRELEINVLDYSLGIDEFLRTDDPKVRQRADKDAADVENHFAEYQRLGTTDRQRDLAKRFMADWRTYHQLGQAFMDAKDRTIAVEDNANFTALRLRLEKFLDDEMQTEAIERFDASKEATYRDLSAIMRFAVGLTALGVVIAFLASWMVVRDLVKREQQLKALNASLATRTTDLAETNRTLYAEIAERVRGETARQVLLLQLALAEEAERLRISREIHDELGQLVTALILGLQAIQRPVAANAADANGLQKLIDLAVQIGRKAHDVATELRPAALDDTGLPAAVQNYLEIWSGRYAIKADFKCVVFDSQRLTLPLETALYRTIQETLTNVAKHAGARHVSIVLERGDDEARAIVEDDGCGLGNTAPWASEVAVAGLGLRGMRERVELVGGHIRVESEPGEGLTLFAIIPLCAPRKEPAHD